MYKIFSWIAVGVWMGLIFYLSHQPSIDSNQLSSKVTEVIVQQIEDPIPIKEIDIDHFNPFIRKNAHFFIYLVFGFLVINAFRRHAILARKENLVAVLFCILYAISDESHQILINGRTPELNDVIIDSAGAFFGILFYKAVSSGLLRGKIVFNQKRK